ncbi:enoyl-CoA hydratase/isomerase family protein [Glaciibacter superstes]|uniref:enoyl-CoA hydratase/isomerase family protein n=1 Tax=Glaciibacter superstes TaxID=501023 RepID=UPI0003B3A5B6|nr:enoyl-CoA hydratase-related protein [Glaciibacter superstes]
MTTHTQSDEATVLYESRDGIATITMNRPRQLNAFDTSMFRGLAEAFIRFREDDGDRVAILTGAGDRSFCAGVDLKERAGSGESGLDFPDIAPLVNPFWPTRTNVVEKPVIAAVNGYAMGGGFYMVLQADLAIASSTAQFEISEIPRGTVAGWETGARHNLPTKAWAEIAFGCRLSAARAYDMGLVNDVVEPDALMDAARAQAEAILRVPPRVIRRNLELLRRVKPSIADDIWTAEAGYLDESRNDPDTAEAIAAFVERREPVWLEARR